MTTITDPSVPLVPKHGYTKDGTSGYARTHHFVKADTVAQVLLPIIIVGQNIQSRAADARATKTFEDVEDARKKIEHAISLLDVNTEGGLHDAVAIITSAISAKAAPGGAGDLSLAEGPGRPG